MADSPAPSSPTVEEALEAVGQTLRTQHAAYLDALRTDGLAPLQEALDRAAAAHEDDRAALPTGAPPSRHALWTAVRRYRRATMASVWRPLRERLEELDLGTLLRDRGTALIDARPALADAVPDTITRPAPKGRYAPAAADGPLRRTGKALLRAWRRGQALLGTHDAAEQTVPMAALVARHAEARLPEAQASALDAAEQTFVRWTARLERTAAAWTHRLLELERMLDRPAFHEVDAPPPVVDAPEADPTSGVMIPDLEAVHDEVQAQAAALHECLEAGGALHLDAVEETLRDASNATVERLRRAADEAGTVLQTGRPGLSRAAQSGRTRRRARLDRWPDWVDEATQRLSFLDALASVRDELVAQHRSLVDDVVAAGQSPVRSAGRATAEGLTSLRDEIDALLAPPDAEAASLASALERRAEDAQSLVQERLLEPLGERAPRRATQAATEAHREAVAAVVGDQPDGFVLHALPDPEEAVTPGEAHTLQWRDGCREVLDELLFDAWRMATKPLTAQTEERTEQAGEVRAVVQFNLDAAVQALREQEQAIPEGGGAASALDTARALAFEGIDRAVELLGEHGEALDRAASSMQEEAWRATTTAWTDLHNRARAAGQPHVHVLRLQGRLARGARWLAVEARRRVRGASTQLRRTLHRIQRQGRRLVRLGHAAVGTTPVDEAALRQTVDALATVDGVLADLPLVYRRLFSFRPLRSEDLLVGREADRAAVERHARRWHQGGTSPLVVTGPAGSGRTSLLNALRTTTFQSAQHHTLELTERVATEAAFTKKLARALSLPHDPDADRTLEALSERIRSLPASDRLRVCTIEQFEHVFQRCVGGTTLGARILSLLSETDAQVLWIVTTSEAAWQFIEASEPAAARLAARHALDPLDRDELEELILTRQRRSGLSLSFGRPDESTHPILARRLRSTDDEERRQALLRTEYFDRLHEACGSNVTLALFYWLRSVRLDEEDGGLQVRPLEPISFEVLDTLPMPHAFALKALLEHSTLTVGELADVTGVPPATSRALLEALGNALLIAPAERVDGPGAFQFASVDRTTRYRLRPLLVQPVIRFLRGRNIVH
jgi:hypothetical protein